ncbi:protein VASCULAR ASSOCIATED DEATH 1, chloroplastic isoform X2 [Diospyros lotus]|uniref:protein VASCULAR ASSOCIATED DEATH 1, chloroplastic isoform X2 n=1 Tax=Diospyros lotus TaxID=55363 RepID=UPI0022591CFA|nr:protein VASCULAR ASSOCIATED DEATH 1, chloroplastic isoform X2 [Diospyros lotus]
MVVESANAARNGSPQSMDAPSQPARVSDAASEVSSSGGLSSSAADPSSSLTRDLLIQAQADHRSEEYRQLFRLPPEEVLVQDFNCALQESFLLQGHMYVFGHFICFYSNLFGFETKKVIHFHEVTAVRRAKAAGIFPTAIEIMAGGKKYFFTSFLSRDEAFKLIEDGWLQIGNRANAVSDLQADLTTEEYADIATENGKSFKHTADDSDSSERTKDIPSLEDSKPSQEAEDGIVTLSGVQDTVKDSAEASDSSSSGKVPAWVEENSDAPKVPDYFTKVAESKFPIKVEDFFNLFFSDNAVDFVESFRRKCGDKDFKCSLWYQHDRFGHARDVTFQHPIKIYLGAKFGSCQEVQKFRVYRNSNLVVETSQEVSDVPYGDYFKVEGRWDVQRDGDDSKDGCMLRVYINVAFSKNTMWKGKIVQNTVEECRDAYAVWIKTAHELLKQKNLEKQVGPSDDLRIVQVGEARQAKIVEPLGGSMAASDLRVSETLPNSSEASGLVSDPPMEENSSGVISLASSFRDYMANFYSSLKSQSQVPLLIVIAFAVILLLMQLSIVVLLARPQKIQLISQADYMGTVYSSSERVPGMMDFLEKRIHHLKDEMVTIEKLLQKMQQEHAFLNAQLKDLEHFRRQRS